MLSLTQRWYQKDQSPREATWRTKVLLANLLERPKEGNSAFKKTRCQKRQAVVLREKRGDTDIHVAMQLVALPLSTSILSMLHFSHYGM